MILLRFTWYRALLSHHLLSIFQQIVSNAVEAIRSYACVPCAIKEENTLGVSRKQFQILRRFFFFFRHT